MSNVILQGNWGVRTAVNGTVPQRAAVMHQIKAKKEAKPKTTKRGRPSLQLKWEESVHYKKVPAKPKTHNPEENRWYKFWLQTSIDLKMGRNEEVMNRLFVALDNGHLFGYRWIAETSHRDMATVIEKCLKADCSGCKYRFKCHTGEETNGSIQ
jgi:hypothetical protein